MFWERPWLLLLWIAAPAIALLLHRARAPLGGGQRLLVAGLGTIAWLALVAALAGPWIGDMSGRPWRTVVAVGESDEATRELVREWRSATPHAEPFRVLAAGTRPAAGPPGGTDIPAAEGAPDLAAALRAACEQAPRDGSLQGGAGGDVVVLGAPRHVAPDLAEVAEQARSRGVRIHHRGPAMQRQGVRLLAVAHPQRLCVGEPFRMTIEVDATEAGTANVFVSATSARDADAGAGRALLAEGTDIELRPGRARYIVEARAPESDGLVTLTTRVVPAGGREEPSQHHERTALLVEGRIGVAHLGSAASREALTETLGPHGFRVDGSLGPDDADVVVVDDVPAADWPTDQQARVRDAILERGTGLLLAGREGNLGPGGYADSPLADLLPVETPQREERRDPSVALVLIMDTSGSMGNRIELAKEVARLSIRRLMPHDKVGIVEFYGSKRWAAPLQPASNVIELMRALNRMQAGGGTIIYSALEESYYALLNVRTRFKHVLVLTDGGVESGPFEALARRMAAAGINLNTVLIGPQANSPFLMNLAQWGHGRFYACPSRFQLPDLRFKEPQTTLLPAVQERGFGLTRDRFAEATRSFDDDWAIGGLVDARPRPAAEVLLAAQDGGRPVLAAWDQGAGRVAVLATDLLGPATDELKDRGWDELVADLLRSLAARRATASEELVLLPSEAALRVELRDATQTGWPMPTAVLRDADGRERARASLTPTAVPGEAVAELPWPDGRAVRVDVEDHAAAACRPLPRDQRLYDVQAAIESLVAATGGTRAGALPTEPPPSERPVSDWRRLAPLLTWMGLGAFLLAVLARRWPGTGRAPLTSAAALIVFLCIPCPAQDAATQGEGLDDPIQSRLQAELQAKGHLDDLAAEWADGTLDQRLALARARGDLAALLALAESADGAERADLAPLRELCLEALGRLDAALSAARSALDNAASAEERAQWSVRVAELLLDQDDEANRAEAEGLLRAAVDAVPDLAPVVGHLAGGRGLVDLALTLHVPADDADARERMRFAMRRAVWCELAEDWARAVTEWRAALEHAGLDREARFILSRLRGAAAAAGQLEDLVADWTARFDQLDSETRVTLCDALRDLGRARDAVQLLERPAAAEDDQLQAEALSIAVEAGEVERAIDSARTRLAADPHRARLRIALALLLTDLRRRDDARALLAEGYAIATRRELLQLTQAASELGDDAAFHAGLDAIRNGVGTDEEPANERDALEALLLEVAHAWSRQQRDRAVQLVLEAREAFTEPALRVRIGESLESMGRSEEAIALYREALESTGAEDLALRLAWLLSNSRDADERAESQALFRRIWLQAGSNARRVQAEERVLDLAAREGTLADLVIELEEALDDPATDHRDARRQALVKIWARAQDSFGAREVLLDWAREEPEHEIEAWQRLATVHLENQEFTAHEKVLRHLIELDPEHELDYRQQLALGFLERGRPGEARAVIREMLADKDDPDPIALEFSAGIFALAGRHEDAARVYRRALAIHPDRIETLLLWANSMAALDRADEAVGRFLDLLLDETIADDLFLVAVDGLLNLEAEESALRFAERALRRRIAVRPDKVYLHRALQDTLEALGDPDARIASLEETLCVAGLQRTAWLRELMDEAQRRRDNDSYLRHARSLLRSGEEVPPAVFLEIGETRLAADDLTGAERAFERARLAPDFARIERRVAELFEQKNRLADAERVRRRILRRDPENPGALLAVASVVERRGDQGEALSLYRDAALRLFDGADFGSEAPANDPRNRGNRNQSDTGPTWPEALEGVLRCARSAADTESLTARLRARVTAAGDDALAANGQLQILEQLTVLAFAWGDAEGLTWVRAQEDRLLASLEPAPGENPDEPAKPDPEASKTRAAIVEARVARGDLEAAAVAAADLPDSEAPDALRNLALLRHDPAAVLTTLEDANPRQLSIAVRELVTIGETEAADVLIERLRLKAEEEPDATGRWLADALRLRGQDFDETELHERALQKALTDESGSVRARVSRILTALRNHQGVDDARRAEILDGLVDLVRADEDDNAAWTLCTTAKDLLPAERLAPLVPIAMQGISQSYALPSRVGLLELLEPAAAVELAREVLGRFPKEEARSTLLRMLSFDEFPESLQLPLLADLKLSDLQPVDRTWIARLPAADLPDATRARLVEILQRDRPREPQTHVMAARAAEAGSEQRSEALWRAVGLIRDEDAPDYSATQALDAIAELADDSLRERVLRTGRETTADLWLRAELLRRADREVEAADLLVAACRKNPDNTSLLNRARPILLELGRKAEVIELFAAAVDAAPQVYPYQAQQLARLLREDGRAAEAIEVLKRAEDPRGTALLDRLRCVVDLEDTEARHREARAWLQAEQAAARLNSGSGVLFVGRSSVDGERVGPDQVLAPVAGPRIAPLDPDDAEESGDLLTFLPEGSELATAMLRSRPPKVRDTLPALYRGLMAGLRSGEDAAASRLAAARATLAERPGDAEALRIVLAAAQLGAAVDREVVARAIERRTIASDADLPLLLDAVATAHEVGDEPLLERLLLLAMRDRNTLSNYRIREQVGPLLHLAAQRDPTALRRLAPGETGANSWLDGDLLSAATLHDPEPAVVREGFRAVGTQLAEGGQQHWDMRMALPWCGLLLRLGDVEGALAGLEVDDPQIASGDVFPAACLAAAAPPLELWSDPDRASDAGDALLARLAPERDAARRNLLFRITALLAIRLEAAGRTDEAATLRSALETHRSACAEAEAWLNPRS